MIKLPDFILKILNTLEASNFTSYVVGGSIRDLLLNKTPKDWDISTPAIPSQIKAIFPHHHTLGEKYGTIGVYTHCGIVQITTFRRESNYHDYRHPRVHFIQSLENDLKRRDFSVNALAFHPKKGLIDPFGGLKDLKNKILRCVGNPQKRFTEDALRILRLARFGATLNFKAEEQTLKSAIKQAHLLHNIAKERIRDELILSLMGDFFTDSFAIYYPIYQEIFPQLQRVKKCHFKNLALLLAFLLEREEDIQALQQLKFDARTIKRVQILLHHKHFRIEKEKTAIKILLKRIGYDCLSAILELQKALGRDIKRQQKLLEEIMVANECFMIKDLQINGKDLQMIQIRGKQIGEILELLLDEVIKEKLPNQKEKLLSRAQDLSNSCLLK